MLQTLNISALKRLTKNKTPPDQTDNMPRRNHRRFFPDNISAVVVEVTNGWVRNFFVCSLQAASVAASSSSSSSIERCAALKLLRTLQSSLGGCHWTNKIVFLASKWAPIDRTVPVWPLKMAKMSLINLNVSPFLSATIAQFEKRDDHDGLCRWW